MIVSGRLGSDDIQEITEAGVDCVLNKPFRINELLAAVQTCLATVPG
jgi:DNA-binding response OmpR family regulator